MEPKDIQRSGDENRLPVIIIGAGKNFTNVHNSNGSALAGQHLLTALQQVAQDSLLRMV